jgi:hypothetical protein
VVDDFVFRDAQVDQICVRDSPRAKEVRDPICRAGGDGMHHAGAQRQMNEALAAALDHAIGRIGRGLASDPQVIIVRLVPAALGRCFVERELMADRRLVAHRVICEN